MKEIHRLNRFWAGHAKVTLYRPDKLCARRKRIVWTDSGLDTTKTILYRADKLCAGHNTDHTQFVMGVRMGGGGWGGGV